jgi:flagellar hook protein FlgE
MASTVSLFSGLSGLSANSRRMEVVGNNIANINTTAFKSNRMLFQPTFSRDFSLGTSPTSSNGGTNPGQIGLGVTLAGTQRNFGNGAISNTGVDTDLAIEGDGFFVVNRGTEQLFTRAGAFVFNSENDLVTITGDRLQGYAVDENFNVVRGNLTNVNIPIGSLTLAETTNNVNFSGNLKANGDIATTGSAFNLSAAGLATGALLTAVGPAGSFATGDTVTLTGAARGDKALPDATFTVTATSTIDELAQFLRDAMGIVHEGGYVAGDPTGAAEPGGITFPVAPPNTLTLTGNLGTANDIDFTATNLVVRDNTGAAKANPLNIAKTADANGESVRTTFVVHDSLGAPLNVDLTMVLVARDANGSYWRAFAHSADDSDIATHLELGARAEPPTGPVPLLQFDNFGTLVSSASVAVELDRANTGASPTLNFNLNFDSNGEGITALADNSAARSNIAAVFEDGARLGVLSSFSVGIDGVITGGFTNGLTRTIGQIAVGAFTNPEGLVDIGNNLFRVGPNSGTPLITEPLNFGTGRMLGGALELSNVDLSEEFINMILTSTGYSAASRVITTTDQMIQQLLTIGR